MQSSLHAKEIEHPKWWDKEDQKVYIWTTRRFKPVPVERLLGTYRFFDMQQERDPFVHMGDTPGYLTLETAPGMPNTPENIEGHFAMSNGNLRGSFSGLTAYHMPDPNDVRSTENTWVVTLHPDPDPKYGHTRVAYVLVVVDAVDDRGNCFINWNHLPTEGSDREHPDFRCYYGKKDAETTAFTGKDPPIALSEAERRRLGIGMTVEEVERIGRERDEKDKVKRQMENKKKKQRKKQKTANLKVED